MSGTALADRQAWLAHVHGCPSCPAVLCATGRRLAYAVAVSMDREECWPLMGIEARPGERALAPFPWVSDSP